MARRYANAALLTFFLVASGRAEDFGRFGYTQIPKIPGWMVDPTGLKPNFPRSDRLYFSDPVQKWMVRSVRAHEASYTMVGGGRGPTRVRTNLFAPGPEILFERGFELKLTTLRSPLLSWGEGSVGEGVETPKCRWIAVSYQDSQPPVLLCFLNEPTSVRVTGRTGDWKIQVVGDPYKKWVRFSLPLGVRALTTTDAAALGSMVSAIQEHEAFWRGPSPVLKRVTAQNDGDAVVGTWEFSGANAVVPMAAFLARKGGYNLQVTSPIKEISAPSDEGPLAYVAGKQLSIRFPVLSLPRGRSITAGAAPGKPPVADPARLFSIYNAALASMMATRPKTVPNQLRSTLDQYLESMKFYPEPITKSQLPIGPSGEGAGEAAMVTLLQQTLLSAEGLNTKLNPLFTSLLWARDAQTWTLPTIQDEKIRRRTTAVAAIAGALSADSMMRLNGAMFQAGLAAERGLDQWLGVTPPPKHWEPVEALRLRLYKSPELPPREPVLPMLVNPVRCLIGPPLRANNRADGYQISWRAEAPGIQRLVLISPQDWAISSLTNASLVSFAMNAPERYEAFVRIQKPGEVTMQIRVTNGPPIKLPPTPEVIYTEVLR